jgi:deoxyribose-phosphate aldolase
MPAIAQNLDFANHHANATADDIHALCENVVKYGFHTAFVNPAYVALAKSLLGSHAKIGCVISFPLGQDESTVKMAAANRAVSDGADELDVVPNLGVYISGDKAGFIKEMTDIVESARIYGKPVVVKFILDPGYFDSLPNKKEAMQDVAQCIQQSGADFVKIGSGMGPRGPSLEDVAIVKEAVPGMNIKVAGGIDTREEAEQFLNAGVSRIGTSHAIDIVLGKKQDTQEPKRAVRSTE